MEVLEIEPIAINLVNTGAIKMACAELIFDHEHNAVLKNDQVGSTAHARN